jgi:hypothetical protein
MVMLAVSRVGEDYIVNVQIMKKFWEKSYGGKVPCAVSFCVVKLVGTVLCNDMLCVYFLWQACKPKTNKMI